MEENYEKAIRELLRRAVGDCEIEERQRLGGLPNRTYYVKTTVGEYVVRLPGEGTEELINRYDEKKSTELACRVGIDAKLYLFDEGTGEKVSEFLSRSQTMHPEDMKKEENIVRAAAIFKSLHESGEDTGVPFDVMDMAETYETFIREKGGFFYEDYPEIRKCINQIKEHYLPGVVKVPCHNDPLCENWILQEGGKMYLIDWEYAGMNDPMWDLADLSIEAGYSDEMDRRLLESYLGRDVRPEEKEAFQINKVLIDYLWSLWGKTRAVYDGEEMEQYAWDRYQRMKKNMKEMG